AAGRAPAEVADLAWLNAVAMAFAPSAVQLETFADFVTWSGGDLSGETWLAHVTGAGALCDADGVFLSSVTREGIHAACADLPTGAAIDPAAGENADLLADLVARLDELRVQQIGVAEAQVASLDAAIRKADVTAFLRWAQAEALDVLRAALKGPENSGAVDQLADLRRHVAVMSTLGLGEVDLAMLGQTPHWIAPGLAQAGGAPTPLDLAQLVWLHRFAALQVAPATDAGLRGYLVLANADDAGRDLPAEARAPLVKGSQETLALLLGCPAADMSAYADALLGAGQVARTVADIDLIAQHVRVASDLGLSATDLLALKRVNAPASSEAWRDAAAAAQAGLSRFDNGNQVPAFRHRLAERERDALVPAFMQTRIAGHPELERRVTNSEQLYGYLLLDVNVTSAVPTSRMVEAISSLQLFISRALADPEPGLSFVDADGVDHRERLATQWELDKEYRQWEANQKLMLYPQNYIEPELRQITSPEFDALQQSVSAADSTPDAVEAAVNAYMKDLAGLCDLSLCSFHFERKLDEDGTERTLYHILAKAKWEPGRFFYRKLEADYETIAGLADKSQYLKAMDWTYWQEVTIPKTFDLFSDVTICVFKNRFYFFWLELEERRVQAADSETLGEQKSLWRLHPRYMRCDQNALAGPMLTPGLFLSRSQEGLTVDGAFEWTGAKPWLYATYQAKESLGGLEYGTLGVVPGAEGSGNDTLTVVFGVDLNGQPEASDRAEAASGPSLLSALHLRLSEEWADAIFNLNETLLTDVNESPPTGFEGISVRPLTMTKTVAEPYIITASPTPDGSETVTTHLKNSRINMTDTFEQGSPSIELLFEAQPLEADFLGRVYQETTLGNRRFTFEATQNIEIKSITETEAPQFSFTYRREFISEKHFASQTGGHAAKGQPVSRSNILVHDNGDQEAKATATLTHPLAGEVRSSYPLPANWSIADGKPAEHRIYVEIMATLPPLKVVTSQGTDTVPRRTITYKRQLLGSFSLNPPLGKINIGWAQKGEHGSRNFLHLTETANRSVDETFVLANSSTVLSRLAKTMPRPGGCETLFQPKNQTGREDFGTFFDEYGRTLRDIYPADTTSLSPDRVPVADFDFNSAYGAYGWEVFYHIPAAIAAGYASSGQFDLAMQWLRRIFDPQLEIPWRVKPLVEAAEPTDGLLFDTGDVITDPDRIARDYPVFYQQATIRNMLEVLLDAGDAAYALQTQESLQRAKALYVTAKQLFSDNLSETLDSLTSTPWCDPTLGDAADDDVFLPPYNGELRLDRPA
ncbi:MAG: neuraminidase-like domain-containing protein, partial [Pseudomonadota bacterium]